MHVGLSPSNNKYSPGNTHRGLSFHGHLHFISQSHVVASQISHKTGYKQASMTSFLGSFGFIVCLAELRETFILLASFVIKISYRM